MDLIELRPLGCKAGYADHPYPISTVADLQELAATSGDWSMYFTLTEDIILLPGVRHLIQILWPHSGQVLCGGGDRQDYKGRFEKRIGPCLLAQY